MSEFDSFFAAIAGQESGGNYSAINRSTGASGKYQIMPANIGPWSKQYLGRAVSVAEFRSSPAIQDQLARAVLQNYYNQYGLRGAAAAWYSGNPGAANNYSKVSNGPSIGAYVDQVLGRMGNARANFEAASVPAVDQAQAVRTGVKRSASSALATPVDQPDLYQTLDPKEVVGRALGLVGVGNGLELGLGAADATQAVGSTIGKANETKTEYRMPVPQASTTTTTGNQASAAPGGTSNALRAAAVAKAVSFQGVPYVWGGTSPSGFDCSGLTQFSLASVGIRVPRVSQMQDKIGPRVPLDAAKPGDLIGFSGGGHIAMYVGNGMMVEAPRPGLTVRVTPVRGAFAVDMSRYYGG